MLRRNPRGDLPEVHPECYVDHTALLIGRVVIEAGVFIGPYAVIRADEVDDDGNMERIVIGAGSNIQDGVVIHSKGGAAVTIGAHCSIAHRAIIHGPCVIGAGSFVGFSSVAFDCVVGDGCVIRHNAVVEHCHLPGGFHVPSCTLIHSDADLEAVPRVSADVRDFSESVIATNRELAKGYRRIANEF